MGMAGLWEVRLLWGVLHRNCISRSTMHTEHSKKLFSPARGQPCPDAKNLFKSWKVTVLWEMMHTWIKRTYPAISSLAPIFILFYFVPHGYSIFIIICGAEENVSYLSEAMWSRDLLPNFHYSCPGVKDSRGQMVASHFDTARASFLMSAYLDFIAVFSGILFPELPFFSFSLTWLPKIWIYCDIIRIKTKQNNYNFLSPSFLCAFSVLPIAL